MNTDRELMQQALEALLEVNYDQAYAKEVAALRERLAQPEQPDELTIWKSRALQAERLIEKFMQPEMRPCAGRNCGSTNPNLHSAECFEDYEKATGMVTQQPGIEELEHENRLMRARNERLEAEVDRLERENFAWRTKLGVRGYEMQIEDLRAKLQGLLHYRSKP